MASTWLILAAVLVVYAYVGYPFLLVAIRSLHGERPVVRGEVTPQLTILIPVLNGESTIAEKLGNTFESDYPQDHLHILLICDGCTDRTAELARGLDYGNLEVLELPERVGKPRAINAAMAYVKGEVVVVTAATVMLYPDSLKKLVRGFADPQVGMITGQDHSIPSKESPVTRIASWYTAYEIWVRRLETEVNTLFVVSGCFYGIRRELMPELVDWYSEDIFVPLSVVRLGFRVIHESEAQARVKTSKSSGVEFRRRIRTFTRGITAFTQNLDILDPRRHGLLSLQFFSHKLCRWLVPFFLVVLLFSSAALVGRGWFYTVAFGMQGLFWTAAVAGLVLQKQGRGIKALNFPAFYLLVNVALLMAWWKVVRGERIQQWQPTQR